MSDELKLELKKWARTAIAGIVVSMTVVIVSFFLIIQPLTKTALDNAIKAQVDINSVLKDKDRLAALIILQETSLNDQRAKLEEQRVKIEQMNALISSATFDRVQSMMTWAASHPEFTLLVEQVNGLGDMANLAKLNKAIAVDDTVVKAGAERLKLSLTQDKYFVISGTGDRRGFILLYGAGANQRRLQLQDDGKIWRFGNWAIGDNKADPALIK